MPSDVRAQKSRHKKPSPAQSVIWALRAAEKQPTASLSRLGEGLLCKCRHVSIFIGTTLAKLTAGKLMLVKRCAERWNSLEGHACKNLSR